jgi:acyl-[acyl-carrier-protein] desaturase
MAAAGIYDLRIHHDQVLRPVLLGHWRLHELNGLDDDAERARDAVMNLLDQLSGGTSSPQPPAMSA